MSKGSIELVSKIVPKSIGNPKVAAAKDENDRTPHILGVLGGKAIKMVMRTMPSGEVYHGLGGEFFGIPYDKDGKPDLTKKQLRSGVMYLPAGIQDVVADQIRDPNTGEVFDGAPAVEFVYEVATVRSGNAAGYSWSFTPLREPEQTDPMSALMLSAGLDPQALLPAPGATANVPAAPEAPVDPVPVEGAKADGKKK